VIANCPPPEKLKSLSLGQLTEEQSDVLVIHLESCEACQNEIAQIDSAEDSLISQLKSSASDADNMGPDNSFETESGCRVAMTRALAALATVEDGSPSLDQAIHSPIPDSIGEYEIVRPLGHGGMGHVYLGKHTKLNRSVAIKFIADHRRWDQTMRERFNSEMRLIGGLKHPNIVGAYDAREVDGIAVLVTEYIDGMTLSEILKRTGSISVDNASKVIAEVCEALEYIESKGLVHRDIKPSNIMVDKDGHVKLLDLGLARIQNSEDTANNFAAVDFTATGQAMGTADYVSPEQINDGRNVDIRTDIYGLGCTFYKLLTGNAPFAEQPSVFSKMNAHVSKAPASLKTNKRIPAKIANLVDSMLAKEPSSRPQHPAEIAQQLTGYAPASDLKALIAKAETLPIQKSIAPVASATNVSPTKPQPKPSFFSNFPWAIALIAAAVAGLLGFQLGTTITVKKPDGTTAAVDIPAGSTAIVDAEGNIEIQLAGSTETARIDKANVKRSPAATENPSVAMEENATTIMELEDACKMYKLNTGAYPRKLEDLITMPSGMIEAQWGGPYLEKEPPLDPYSYSIDQPNDQVEITTSLAATTTTDKAKMLQGEKTLGYSSNVEGIRFTLPAGCAIYQKAERGDFLDIFLVKKNKRAGEPDQYDLTSKRLVATKVKVLAVSSSGKHPFRVTIKNPGNCLLNEETRWNFENLRFEFHNPNNQLVEDRLRLYGVWRSVLMRDDGEEIDFSADTIVCRNNQWLTLTGQDSLMLEFKLKQGGYLETVNENAVKTQYHYRFLGSGRLELGDSNNCIRYQKVETPESKNEKIAFEMRAQANSNPDYFRCHIAKPVDASTAKFYSVEGASEPVELVGQPVINRNHVLSAKVIEDERGKPNLSMKLTPEGALRMQLATKKHIGHKMALLIDGKVRLAPNINSVISDSLTLTGDFTKPELEKIAKSLSTKLELPKGSTESEAATRPKSLNNLK
jgi:serine/threonine protein kinase